MFGAAFVAAGIVLAMFSLYEMRDSETVAKALLIIAVPAMIRGVWEWSRVDGLLAFAIVVGLAFGAMGRQALVNAADLHRDDLSTRGYIFLGIAAAAGALAAFRVFRALRRDS